MKKMPSLYKRDYETNQRTVTNQMHELCQWVIDGEGTATEKIDGTCCMVENGVFYKRYDAKRGKTPPEGFIPAQEPDAITGHYPGWIKVSHTNSEDKHHIKAWGTGGFPDGTYELIGNKINGNPYQLPTTELIKHGTKILNDVPTDFEGLKEYLKDKNIEGIVWHHSDGRMCKIKRTDFGYQWPIS